MTCVLLRSWSLLQIASRKVSEERFAGINSTLLCHIDSCVADVAMASLREDTLDAQQTYDIK